MKRSITIGIILIVIMTVFLTGCEDNGNNENQNNNNNPPADTTKPTITSTNPKHGEKNIDLMPTITLEFSERMKMTEAQNNVMIISPSRLIPDQEFEWVHSQELKIHIKDRLAFDTTYTFEIRGLADEAGNLIDVYTLTLTTNSPSSVNVIIHEMKCYFDMDTWSAPDIYAKIEANEKYGYTSTYEDTYSAKPEYLWETEVDEYLSEVTITLYDDDVSTVERIGGFYTTGTYADHEVYEDNAIYVCYSLWYT